MEHDYKQLKVLIADDKPSMLRTLMNMLKVIGFEYVSKAPDGEKAMEALRNTTFDLVLCDWNMPRMRGIDVLRMIREDDRLRSTPFIMITGETDAQVVAEAGEVEVDGYLLKPFTHEDLKTKIDQTLSKKVAPSQIDIHLSLAKVYLDARQYDQSENELKKGYQLNPRSPRVLFALGQVYEAKKEPAKARKYYQGSVEQGKCFLKGHEALARLCEALGDHVSAAEHLRLALQISPRNVQRHITLGNVLVKTGNKAEISKVLQNAMKIAETDHAEIARQVGEAYLEAGMLQEAQNAFSVALEADPKAVHIYNRMGIALRRQKKFNEAVENYRRALQFDSEDEGLYYNLARAYFEAGDKEKSIAAMKYALKLFPDFEEAKDFLTRLGAA